MTACRQSRRNACLKTRRAGIPATRQPITKGRLNIQTASSGETT
ncbi:hypothetical protein [Neisseria canis]|nr:hypothetical protein [Neisseria canis]